MKKYLLFLLTILSISLTGCSSNDDYCNNGFYRSPQLKENPSFPTYRMEIRGVVGDSYTVIRSEREFQERVKGANFYRNIIDFRHDDLIIGQKWVNQFNDRYIIDIIPTYKESCNYNYKNILEVDILLNKGRINDYVTYHTIVPKTKVDQYDVITNVIIKN